MKNLAVILLVLLAPVMASRGFVLQFDGSGNIIRWDLVNLPGYVNTNSVNPSTKSIRFFVASDAYSTTNTTAELNAVRASFDQWQAIPGTNLKFEYAGLVGAGQDINTSDHTNIVYWVKNGTLVNGGTANISGALGVTFTSILNGNVLTEADIVLNGYYYNWFTDLNDATGGGKLFIEGVLTHEIGHFIGLNHSPVGTATMFARGNFGADATQVGLSSDEMAAARFLYPTNTQSLAFGVVAGTVKRSSTNIFGAVVVAETSAGNITAGTVTELDGSYQLPALAPGTYVVRVTPLNTKNASRTLVKGSDIAGDYINAATDFLPATNASVTVSANTTNTVNFTLASGAQTFFVTDVRPPTTDTFTFSTLNTGTSIYPGQSNYVVGVYGPNLPTSGAVLTITGDGLTLGTTEFDTLDFGSVVLNCMTVPISVASNATPGLRSFVVTSNSVTTYATGFLEVLPLVPDNNFDGLDDRFQRQYFARFTMPEAAPTADPDGDNFNNLSEYVAGTDPTNGTSLLKITSVTQNLSGAIITWKSVSGKKYQVWSRDDLSGAAWQKLGNPVTASTTSTQYNDAAGTGQMKYYFVQVLP